jgi:hypothetical protein
MKGTEPPHPWIHIHDDWPTPLAHATTYAMNAPRGVLLRIRTIDPNGCSEALVYVPATEVTPDGRLVLK